MTLGECRRELSSIISEMESIETGVRSDFAGIGEQLCGDCIAKVEEKYRYVLRKLRNVDTNRFAEWVNGGTR